MGHIRPVAFKFLSGGSVYAWGVSVGTYKGVRDGKNIGIRCVDFQNHISPGNQFSVNVTGLAVGANISNTRFGNLPGQLELVQVLLQQRLRPDRHAPESVLGGRSERNALERLRQAGAAVHRRRPGPSSRTSHHGPDGHWLGRHARDGLGSAAAAAAAAGIVRRPSSIHGGWKGAGKCRRPFYVRRRVVRAGPIHDR